jgi:hypothetical protein
MKHVRTLGRRIWETRLPIRFAGFIAIFMLSVSVWFLQGSVKRLQEPHSPHYGVNHCLDCHEGDGKHTEDLDCFTCHDKQTRELLPSASSASCVHPVRGVDTPLKSLRTVTALCISCHKKVTGFVAMVDISTGKYVEVDMAVTHPIGLMPTASIYPRTLPLSKETGAINCITCHDQHAVDKRLRMLRYYYPGNGHPADFRPLCLDCHPDGWLPLKVRPKSVEEAVIHHE